jgi:hypothetical protein
MNSEVNGIESWNAQKLKLKEMFLILTGSNLFFEDSKRDEMFLKLQAKLGKSREELLQIISKL